MKASLFGESVDVHKLADGTRVIPVPQMVAALARLNAAQPLDPTSQGQLEGFVRIVRSVPTSELEQVDPVEEK